MFDSFLLDSGLGSATTSWTLDDNRALYLLEPNKSLHLKTNINIFVLFKFVLSLTLFEHSHINERLFPILLHVEIYFKIIARPIINF